MAAFMIQLIKVPRSCKGGRERVVRTNKVFTNTFWMDDGIYLGTVTFPALSSDPSVNQSELPSVKSLTYCLTDVERRMALQPDFDQRWTEKRTKETAKKMAPTAAQTSVARGDMKDKNPGFCFMGFLIIMLIPSSMNGALKSTTLSLADVMVMAPRATSVSFKRRSVAMMSLF